MDNIEIYNTDIEMVMDFIKISILHDSTTINNRKKIINLQKKLLKILPVAQNERVSSIYILLQKIYHINKKEYFDKKIQS